MKYEWNLDALYKGYDDPKFKEDFDKVDEAVNALARLAATLSHSDEEEMLVTILKEKEAYALLMKRLAAYIGLRQTTNTSDPETTSLYGTLMQKNAEVSKPFAQFDAYIASCDDLDKHIQANDYLKEYAYLLKETKEDAKHMLSEEVEDVLTKMNLSGGSAWEDLHSFLTSTLEVPYKDEVVTLSQIRNYAYDADPAVRKLAYEAELKGYDKIKDSIAFSLNNIKSQVIMETKLRKFDSPLAMTLYGSKMKQETLDAMLEAMEEYMPKFRAYLKRKGELLGYKNGLPFYELFAPIKETSKEYSVEEAKDYLLKHFSTFSDDLCDMVKQAFDDEWIDFFPRKGKVGGAFCYNLPFIKQSRVLSNYDNGIGDIVTLAHELGHAYHGMMIQDHRPLNTTYSMPVAETASTFNENIILNAAIDEAKGDEKIALIENQLQDLTQIILDIYSRFLFEKSVFENRESSFMFADDLSNLMKEAQIKAYGDGLDPEFLHPYMWVCKGHYYSSDLSYYNFPYAFGGLFARGLIVKYQEEGKAFLPKYRELLKATTVASVEDVAKMADIDITKPDFWKSSLQTAANRIDEFLELTK